MKKVSAFETSDGKIFSNEKEAMLHENSLGRITDVDAFLSSDHNPYKSTPQRVVARSSILNWENWKDHHVE